MTTNSQDADRRGRPFATTTAIEGQLAQLRGENILLKSLLLETAAEIRRAGSGLAAHAEKVERLVREWQL